MNLNEAESGKFYKIVQITGPYRQKLAIMGFNPGCKVSVKNILHNQLYVINCRESQIALRKQEAECIQIEDHDV